MGSEGASEEGEEGYEPSAAVAEKTVKVKPLFIVSRSKSAIRRVVNDTSGTHPASTSAAPWLLDPSTDPLASPLATATLDTGEGLYALALAIGTVVILATAVGLKTLELAAAAPAPDPLAEPEATPDPEAGEEDDDTPDVDDTANPTAGLPLLEYE